MDLNFVNDLMLNNKEKVLNLFLKYQMVEMLLFLQLGVGIAIEETSDKDRLFKQLNDEINKKTLGGIKRMYLKKYPNDELEILPFLNIVINERNHYMHSMWTFMALFKPEDDREMIFNQLITQYTKNVDSLMNLIIKIEKTPLEKGQSESVMNI